MKKRALSILLAMCMVVSTLPAAALAEESNEGGVTMLPGAVEGVITLTEDVALSEPFVVQSNETVVLDLNGKTISGTDTTDKNFGLIQNNGTLTVRDNAGGGKITLNATIDSSTSRYSAVISNNPGGTLVIDGGTLEHLGGTYMAYGIDSLTNGGIGDVSVTINGGTIKSSYRAIRQFLNSDSKQNVLTINGGTIEGPNKSVFFHDPSKKANNGTLTIGASAVLKGDVYLFVTADSTNWPVSVSISDDALQGESAVIPANVPGQYLVENNNGTWTKTNNPAYGKEAAIGTTYFDTLAEAVEAAQPGGTITLVANVTLTDAIVIDKNIILDGGNHTVNAAAISGSDCAIITASGCTIRNMTVTGNANKTRAIGPGSSGTYVLNGTLTLENVTIDSVLYAINGSGASDAVVNVNDSEIYGWSSFSEIKSFNFTNCTLTQGNSYDGYLNIYGATSFTNCTFEDVFDIGARATDNVTHAAGKIIEITNCTYGAADVTADNFEENFYYGPGDARDWGNLINNCIIVVDGEILAFNEASLKNAIIAAQPGDTITLVADVELTNGVTVPAGSTVTLDLNGKVLSGNSEAEGSSAVITNYGTLSIQDSSTGKTGKITAFAANPDTAIIPAYANNTISNSGTLNLYSGTIENSTGDEARACFPIDNNSAVGRNAVLNIYGGTVTGRGAIRQFTTTGNYVNVVNIFGGTIYGRSYALWLQNPAGTGGNPKGQLNVKGGTLSKILLESSSNFDVAISDGEITEVAYWSPDTVNPERVPTGFISGGTFSADPTAYLADGYVATKSGSTWTVAIPTPAAKVGETSYFTLDAAIAAAQKGDTVTLLKDIVASTYIEISKPLTLNLSGFDIIREGEGTGLSVEDIAWNEVVNIVGEGTIDAGLQALMVLGGTVNIYGGTFSSTEQGGNVLALGNASTTASIKVYGGTFMNFNPASYVANGYVSVAGSDNTYTVIVKEEPAPAPDYSDDDYYVPSNPTVSTETSKNEDGSTTTTETKKDGTTVETTTGTDGSTTKTEAKTEVKETATSTTTTTTSKVETKDSHGNKTTVESTEKVVETKDSTTKTTETTTKTEAKTETVKTEEKVVTNEDGSKTTTTTTETATKLDNGSTGTTKTDETGKTEAAVKVSSQAVAEAAKAEEPVVLAMPTLEVSKQAETFATVTVALPAHTAEATVAIPVAESVGEGTVAVLVNADGTETILTNAVITESGLIANVPNGATVKVVDNSADFDDVAADDWEKDAVDFTSARNITNGTGEGFSPDMVTSRAMVWTMLARLEGVDTDSGENWWAAGQKWAVENGISDGTNADGEITREQLAVMLYRYVGEPEYNHEIGYFADQDETSDWALDSKKWAVGNKVIKGKDNADGTLSLDPTGSASRAEVAQMLMNFIKNVKA